MGGRARRAPVGHRGGKGFEGHGNRGSNDDRWDPGAPEDDPYRDLRVPDEDPQDPANEDYVWPEYEEEEDD